MKRGLVLLLVLATASFSFAEHKKGQIVIGTYLGSGSWYSSTSDSSSSAYPGISKSEYTSWGFGLGPEVGYFIADNIVLGTYLGVNFNGSKSDSSSTTSSFKSTSKYNAIYFSVGPFGRFYFGGGAKGSPYVQVNAGASFYPSYKGTYTPSTGTGYDYKYKTYSSWNLGLMLGYEHFLNSFVALQYYVGYGFSSYKTTSEYDYASGTDPTYDYSSKTNSLEFGVGLQIFLDKKKS